MKTHYRRYLPHILPPGHAVFITFRLADSLPVAVIRQLADEKAAMERGVANLNLDEKGRQEAYRTVGKQYFARFDDFLAKSTSGEHWLKKQTIAELVQAAIHYRDGTHYTLHAYCVMSNHVHLLVTIPDEDTDFYRVLQSLKRHTALEANRILQRSGQSFWHPESYDHVIRNGQEFKRVIAYILNNPVKAGLVESWEEWPYSYVTP